MTRIRVDAFTLSLDGLRLVASQRASLAVLRHRRRAAT
jgi:hypothetical protein